MSPLVRDTFRLSAHEPHPADRRELRRQAARATGRCPYCGGRKRGDKPTCRPCDDLPGREGL